MKAKTRRMLFLAGLSLLPALCRELGATLGVEERILLENALTEKVRGVTQKLLGNEDFLIWVKITVDFNMTQETRSVVEPLEGKTGKTDEKNPGADQAMPGITQTFLPQEFRQEAGGVKAGVQPLTQQIAQTVKIPSDYVKSMSVRIIVPKAVTDEKIEDLKKVLPMLIGLEAARGDGLAIERIAFRRDSWEQFLYWKNNLNPFVFWVFGLLMLTAFLFGPVRTFLNRFAQSAENFSVEGRIGGNLPPLQIQQGFNEMRQLPQAGAGGGPTLGGGAAGLLEQKDGAASPFAFVNADNISKLSLVLAEADAQILATVAAYLPANISSKLLDSLSPEMQREVFILLSSPRTISPEAVVDLSRQLENQVKSIVGGVDQILLIMDTQAAEKQGAMMEEMRIEHPELVEDIQRRMLTVEKIIGLDKNTLQSVLWEAYRQRVALGTVFKGLTKDLQTTAMAALPEALHRVLADELNRQSSAAQQEAERKRFMQVVRGMEQSGRITLGA
ncbi:MAG: hypothetical protein HY611_09860 [Elusimicrobia bacterium]|nr:hypothetical protein [Elusimicrobiota bacterium]